MAQLNDRLNSFQKQDSTDFHKQRQQKYSINLRRTKRSSYQNKKRSLQTQKSTTSFQIPNKSLILPIINSQVYSFSPYLQNSSLSDQQKLQILQNLLLNEIPEKIAFHILQTIQLTLQIQQHFPIKILTNLKFSQAIIKYLNIQLYNPSTVDLSCAIISTFTSNNHQSADQIVSLGGIPKLLLLISRPDTSKNALHALANLSGDCSQYREELLNLNFLEILKNFFNTLFDPGLEILKVIAWNLSNISRAANEMGKNQIKETLEMIIKVLAWQDKDVEILAQSLRAAVYLSRLENEHIDFLIQSGIQQYAISGLFNQNQIIRQSSVRLIGNICSGTAKQTDYILQTGILDKLHLLLKSDRNCIKKYVYWVVSNIAAGSLNQLWILVLNQNFPEYIRGIIEPFVQTKLEAAFILKNFVFSAKENFYVKLQLVPYFELIAQAIHIENNTQFLKMLLEVVGQILAAGRAQSDSKGCFTNNTIFQFQKSGCLSAVQQLLYQINQEIFLLAQNILDEFIYEQESFYTSNQQLSL